MKFTKYFGPFKNLALFYVIVSFLLRLILLFHPITQTNFDFFDSLKIFLFGLLSDFFVFILLSSFLWLYLIFLSDTKYNKPYGYIIFAVFVGLLIYLLSGKSILDEYGGALPEIGISFITIKTILFGLLLFLPKYRKYIRFLLFSFTIFIFVLVIIQNAVSEFFFWNEFGVRYNFIAVDYLVYTNTVIGNIMESYPILPLFTGIGIVSLAFSYIIIKESKYYIENLPNLREKIKISLVLGILFLVSLQLIPLLSKQENSKNKFTNELQSNGIYRFFLAFQNSELDFIKFYSTIPNKEAYAILNKYYPTSLGSTTVRTITSDTTEIKKNVVLITIESLSAEFMSSYGNKENITPFLDSLSSKSIFFSNLYATGNRTVRGLEAVTICIPPSPGESVVKRKDNKNKFTTASIFKKRGYQVNYLYGGDAYFDNMQDFFSGNGYTIYDKSSLKPEQITFSNVWGVCDEDMANKAIDVMNKDAAKGKPFFSHWMTVSNHRPFTFPEGKIDISGTAKSRNGGVKYTDYALRKFFKMAENQPWFKNTVFVIVSDHCASSSGKTELPLDKYRIPAMIYAPGFIKATNQNVLMSQIDLMPTLFGLLHFTYESKFFGQDIFNKDYKPRAFIATYQDLGFIKNDILTIISPVKKSKQFKLDVIKNISIKKDFQIFYDEILLKNKQENLIKETTAFYQVTSEMLLKKQYDLE